MTEKTRKRWLREMEYGLPRERPAIEKARLFEHGQGYPKVGDYVEDEDGEIYRVRTVDRQTCQCDDEERHMHAELEPHDIERETDPDGELFEDCTVTFDDDDELAAFAQAIRVHDDQPIAGHADLDAMMGQLIETSSASELIQHAAKIQALSVLLGVAAGLSQAQFRELRDSAFERDWLSACAALTPGPGH